MDIISVTDNANYNEVIDFAFECCDEFILVVRKEMDLSDDAKSILEKLRCFLKNSKEQSEWPGTRLGGCCTAQVYYYNTDNKAKEIIKDVTDSLHSWVQPNLPEDLTFIKNGTPWLINTAHEGYTDIVTYDKDEFEKAKSIEGLIFR